MKKINKKYKKITKSPATLDIFLNSKNAVNLILLKKILISILTYNGNFEVNEYNRKIYEKILISAKPNFFQNLLTKNVNDKTFFNINKNVK